MRLAIRIMLLLVLAGCGHAFGTEDATIPFVSVAGADGPAGGLRGTLWWPSGPPPFGPQASRTGSLPVVILLHGCGGIGPNQTLWAKRLNGWGFAALILDSFGPRGVRSVCAPTSQPQVRLRDRAADVISAALWLRGQPGVDPSRIAVMGESHGGASAAWVTQQAYASRYPGLLKAAVDYYGSCRRLGTPNAIPLLVLAGEADDWGQPAQTCRDFAARLPSRQPFELHIYPGAVYGFDNPRLTNVRMNQGHAMHYDPSAAEDSYAAVHAFLNRMIGAPS